MAVSAKGRRHIEVDGRRYLWWVAEDNDSPFIPCGLAITVASEDRRFLVRYHLHQPDERRHVTVLGQTFKGVPGCGGGWRRFRSPAFGTPNEVRPSDIATLIRWCVAAGARTTEVDYKGDAV